MFQGILNATPVFTMDFGEALDAHGMFIKIMFEQGTFGLITFTILLLTILYYISTGWPHKKDNIYLISSLMIAVGSITYQTFNTMYYTSKLWIPLAIAVLIAHYYKKRKLTL